MKENIGERVFQKHSEPSTMVSSTEHMFGQTGNEDYSVGVAMEETVACPVCGKKIMDIDWVGKWAIETKCPRCKRLITVKRSQLQTTRSKRKPGS